MNYLYFGMSLEEAVTKPRVQTRRNETFVENDKFDEVGFLHLTTKV